MSTDNSRIVASSNATDFGDVTKNLSARNLSTGNLSTGNLSTDLSSFTQQYICIHCKKNKAIVWELKKWLCVSCWNLLFRNKKI